MARIISACAGKGGVGKTALICSLADAARMEGKKALCVDADGQGTLSEWLRNDSGRAGCYEVITGRVSAGDAVQHTDSGIDLISGSRDIVTLKSSRGSARRLFNALEAVADEYDLILIDSGPTISEAMNNVLYASDLVLIPVVLDGPGLQGVYEIYDMMEQAEGHGDRKAAVVVSMYDSRPKLNRFMLDRVRQAADEMNMPVLGMIRSGVSVHEAVTMQEPIFSYAPHSKPAQDFLTVYRKVVEM